MAAVIAACIAFSLIIPLPGVAASPLICMVMATPPASIPAGGHIAAFAAGCLWATAILLTPFVGGKCRPVPTSRRRPRAIERLRRAARDLRAATADRTPAFRYAIRVCACFTAAYIVTRLLGLPHATWALVGLLTTLRPDWDDTRSRITKRLVGMAGGCVLTAALLSLTRHHSPLWVVLAIAACGGIARPMRQFNYGYWPIFGTPVLLLLVDFSTPLNGTDVAFRMIDNALGALLAFTAAVFFWPARQQLQIPGQIGRVLDTHARFLERVATIIESGPPQARENNHGKAEAAAAELASSRDRIAGQPFPPAALLSEIDATVSAAGRLRDLVRARRPYHQLPVHRAPEMRRLARQLRDAADAAHRGTAAGPRSPAATGTSSRPDLPAPKTNLRQHPLRGR
jgi:uncharacterized membrane protein YccC